jgi:hypothetical protein
MLGVLPAATLEMAFTTSIVERLEQSFSISRVHPSNLEGVREPLMVLAKLHWRMLFLLGRG